MFKGKRLATVLAASALTASMAGFVASPVAAQSVETLQNQINALQSQINELKSAQEKAAKNDVKVKWEPAPKISSADGRFEMNMRGRLLIDAGWISDDDDSSNIDSTEFRAARLGIEGKAWNNIKYKFEADFADNEVSITDALIGYDLGLATVSVGQFKTFNSLEEQTSSRYISFLERGGITDAFSLSRQLGIGVNAGGENWSAAFGVFKGDADGGNGDRGETYAGRVTFAPKIGDAGVVHVGAHIRHQKQGSDDGLLRYRQRPHHHLGDRFIDTGSFADSDTLYGVELAGVFGPFSAQGEYMVLKADRTIPVAGFKDPTFKGWYADLTYVITGESRNYDAEDGAFGRLKVADPVTDGGMGAWQVGIRYDYVDLTDEDIFGGVQDTWIFGVNWHLNNYSRIMFNYSMSDVKKAFDVSRNGADGKNDIDAFGLRFQVDW